MNVLTLTQVDKERWNNIIKLSDYNDVFMSYEWCQVAQNVYGQEPLYFILQQDERDIGAFVVFVSSGRDFLQKIKSRFLKTATVYSGPMITTGDREEGFATLIRKWEEYAWEHNIISIGWNMFTKWEAPESFEKLVYDAVKYTTHILRLDDKTEDELFNNLKRENRKAIRKAWNHNVVVERYNGLHALPYLKDFHNLFQKTYEHARGSSIGWKSLKLMEEVYMQFRDNAYLFVAYYNNKMAAGATIIRLGNTINFNPVGASDIKLTRESRAANLLHWEIIRWAKSESVQYYDFGGASPTDLSNGVTRFKGSFGGDYKIFYGGYKIYSPLRKELLDKIFHPLLIGPKYFIKLFKR